MRKRGLAFLLAIAFSVGIVPVPAMAAEKTLVSVAVTGPTKTQYEFNEMSDFATLAFDDGFDWSTLISITATYSDGTTADVTNDSAAFVASPALSLLAGNMPFFAMYTYNDVTKYASFNIFYNNAMNFVFTPPGQRVYNLTDDYEFASTGAEFEITLADGTKETTNVSNMAFYLGDTNTELTDGDELTDYITIPGAYEIQCVPDSPTLDILAQIGGTNNFSFYIIVNADSSTPYAANKEFVSIEDLGSAVEYFYNVGENIRLGDVKGFYSDGTTETMNSKSGFGYGITGKASGTKGPLELTDFGGYISYAENGFRGDYGLNVRGVPAVLAFATNGGNVLHANVLNQNQKNIASLPSPTKSGYTFAGWHSDAALTNRVTFPFAMPNAAMTTLYAKWTVAVSKNKGSSRDSGTTSSSQQTNTPAATAETVAAAVKEGNDVVLNVSSGSNSVALSKDDITSILKAEVDIIIQTSGGTLTITPAILAASGIDGSSDVNISFTPAASNLLSETKQNELSKIDPINDQLLKSRVFDVTISSDKNAVTTFTTPLELAFDIKSFDMSNDQKSRITAIRVNKDGSINQLGGKLSGNTFKAYTSKTSQYGIIVSDSLKSIHVTLNNKDYTLNGKPMTTDVAPTITNDRTMVPVRFIAEALGADVSWDDVTKTAAMSLDGKTTSVTIGKLSPGMDAAPVIVDSRTLVPLRFIAEAFDSNVVWNEKDKSIDIYR